jgi:hypothetical protein
MKSGSDIRQDRQCIAEIHLSNAAKPRGLRHSAPIDDSVTLEDTINRPSVSHDLEESDPRFSAALRRGRPLSELLDPAAAKGTHGEAGEGEP